MKISRMHWIGIISGAVVLLADIIFYFIGSDKNMNLLLFIGGIAAAVIVFPFVAAVMIEGKKEEEINEMFLEFTRNLAESVNTGTPISRSIINMKNRNYGELSPYIVKLANQIDLGIPLNRALQNFARDVDNIVISRAVALISEAEKAGGQIDYILASVARSISEVEKLKKERKAAIYNLVVQGYIIFFIFIGIMLIMKFKILPITSEIGSFGGMSSNLGSLENLEIKGATFTADELSRPFLFLLIAQGFFAGLTIGKLAEGSIKKGIKHSFILMMVSFLVYTGATVFVGG